MPHTGRPLRGERPILRLLDAARSPRPVPLTLALSLDLARRGGSIVGMTDWPRIGSRVVVWFERVPSKAPRDPYEAVVDHIAGRSFTVRGLDATFNRSTGRSKPVRRTPGAFGSDTYVAVDASSDRGREVLGAAVRSDREADADAAVRAWLIDRSDEARHRAIDALNALDED